LTTRTILKDDGIYIYEDYKLGRAALRLKELSVENPVQNIRRHSDPVNPVEAMVVSAADFDTKVAAYTAVNAPSFKQVYHTVSDDYMGSNLSKMIDLVRGRAQTKALVKMVTEEGLTGSGFVTYKLISSAEWFQDQSPVIPFEESAKKAGQVLAYLMHPTIYAALDVAPVATIYAGAGDGTLASSLMPGGAVAETITATALDPSNFAIVGTVSGAMGTAAVGSGFVSPQIEILITNGSLAFVAGDVFTINSIAAPF